MFEELNLYQGDGMYKHSSSRRMVGRIILRRTHSWTSAVAVILIAAIIMFALIAIWAGPTKAETLGIKDPVIAAQVAKNRTFSVNLPTGLEVTNVVDCLKMETVSCVKMIRLDTYGYWEGLWSSRINDFIIVYYVFGEERTLVWLRGLKT